MFWLRRYAHVTQRHANIDLVRNKRLKFWSNVGTFIAFRIKEKMSKSNQAAFSSPWLSNWTRHSARNKSENLLVQHQPSAVVIYITYAPVGTTWLRTFPKEYRTRLGWLVFQIPSLSVCCEMLSWEGTSRSLWWYIKNRTGCNLMGCMFKWKQRVYVNLVPLKYPLRVFI